MAQTDDRLAGIGVDADTRSRMRQASGSGTAFTALPGVVEQIRDRRARAGFDTRSVVGRNAAPASGAGAQPIDGSGSLSPIGNATASALKSAAPLGSVSRPTNAVLNVGGRSGGARSDTVSVVR